MSSTRPALKKKILEEFPLSTFEMGSLIKIKTYLFDKRETPIPTTFNSDGTVEMDTSDHQKIITTEKFLRETSYKSKRSRELYRAWTESRWK